MRKKKVKNLIPGTYATSLRCKIPKSQEYINAGDFWVPVNLLFLHQHCNIHIPFINHAVLLSVFYHNVLSMLLSIFVESTQK